MEANKITQNANKSIFFPFLAPLYVRRTSAAIAAVVVAAAAEATVQPSAAPTLIHSDRSTCFVILHDWCILGLPSVCCQIVNWSDCQFDASSLFSQEPCPFFKTISRSRPPLSIAVSLLVPFSCSFSHFSRWLTSTQCSVHRLPSKPHTETQSSQKVHRDNNNRTQFIWK